MTLTQLPVFPRFLSFASVSTKAIRKVRLASKFQKKMNHYKDTDSEKLHVMSRTVLRWL